MATDKELSNIRGPFRVYPKKKKEEPSPTEQMSIGFRKKIKERDYIEGFDEIAKGIETGKHDLLTSLGELLFMGTDAAFNTDFISDFQKMMDEQKPDEPETWRGELGALLVPTVPRYLSLQKLQTEPRNFKLLKMR